MQSTVKVNSNSMSTQGSKRGRCDETIEKRVTRSSNKALPKPFVCVCCGSAITEEFCDKCGISKTRASLLKSGEKCEKCSKTIYAAETSYNMSSENGQTE